MEGGVREEQVVKKQGRYKKKKSGLQLYGPLPFIWFGSQNEEICFKMFYCFASQKFFLDDHSSLIVLFDHFIFRYSFVKDKFYDAC